MNYIKQLNVVRAIAVMLVIISHWLPAATILNRIPTGQIGVDIFFVLSGFLITSILIENKHRFKSKSKSALLKVFYWRRMLRIFPAYYLTILVLYVVGDRTGTDIRSSFGYFLTYTSNFYFFKNGQWDGMLSHLWSLAVEEQFYFFWPFLIFYINDKYLKNVMLIFIGIGIASQYLLRNNEMGHIVTTTCFDGFGLGALLAWHIKSGTWQKFYQLLSFSSIPAFFLFVLGVVQGDWVIIPLRTLISVMSLWIIAYIYLNHASPSMKFKFILNNRLLIFIGKISYGIYLYHNLIPIFNEKFLKSALGINTANCFESYSGKMVYLENMAILLLVSSLSYFFLEIPFLKLKDRYFGRLQH